MHLLEYLNLPYLPSSPPNTFQTFDAYVPQNLLDTPHPLADTSALLCFIHGGAWRTEDKADHAALARDLALSTGYPVAVPNYRLTPLNPTPENALQHPAHAEDVLRFLELVLSWYKGRGHGKRTQLFLIGHSCAAHMLCSMFLRMPGDSDSVCPSDELVRSTAAVIMSDGIYDIDLLLSSFPGYRSWFIENTFGTRDTFEDVSAFEATIDPKSAVIRWFIIHSKGDTVIDQRQSKGMYNSLKEKSCLVSRSFDELEDEHDDVVKSTKYVGMIDRYIKDVVGSTLAGNERVAAF